MAKSTFSQDRRLEPPTPPPEHNRAITLDASLVTGILIAWGAAILEIAASRAGVAYLFQPVAAGLVLGVTLGVVFVTTPRPAAWHSFRSLIRERQGDAGAKTLEVAGGFAPTIGILGTVIGLIDIFDSQPARCFPASRLVRHAHPQWLAGAGGRSVAGVIACQTAGRITLTSRIANAIAGSSDVPRSFTVLLTDAVPIHNARFQNNWELSAARSLQLLHLLTARYGIAESRRAVISYGSQYPVVRTRRRMGGLRTAGWKSSSRMSGCAHDLPTE